MAWLKRVGRWFKHNWKWVAGGATLLVLSVLGMSYRRDLKKAAVNRNKIRVLKSEREVARLEGQRDVIRRQESAVESDIAVLDEKISAKFDEIQLARTEIEKLTAEQKLQRFKDLGY